MSEIKNKMVCKFAIPECMQQMQMTLLIDGWMKQKIKEKESFIKRTILEHTKIKEPITKGKLRWHGITIGIQQGNLYDCWIEQRGKKIGDTFSYSIVLLETK